MADIFKEHLPRLESPLNSMELVPVSYTGSGYIFNKHQEQSTAHRMEH